MNDMEVGYVAHGVGPLSPPDPDGGVDCKHCGLPNNPDDLWDGSCSECRDLYHCIECMEDKAPMGKYKLCPACEEVADNYAIQVMHWTGGEQQSDVLAWRGCHHLDVLKSASHHLEDLYHEFVITHIGRLSAVEEIV